MILLFLIGLFFIACIHSFDVFSRCIWLLLLIFFGAKILTWRYTGWQTVSLLWEASKCWKALWGGKYLLLKVFEKELQELRPVWAPTCNWPGWWGGPVSEFYRAIIPGLYNSLNYALQHLNVSICRDYTVLRYFSDNISHPQWCPLLPVFRSAISQGVGLPPSSPSSSPTL